MKAGYRQDEIVMDREREVVPRRVPDHYAVGGELRKPPMQADGGLVTAEVEELIAQRESSFYLARQPILKYSKRDGCWYKVYEELLLRARNDSQMFPACFVYWTNADQRRRFSEYQLIVAETLLKEDPDCPIHVNFWIPDLLDEALKAKVIDYCQRCPSIWIELTEFQKNSDKPCFPTMLENRERLVVLAQELKAKGVKLSLDDVNDHNGDKYPYNYEFALQIAEFVDEIKLDIKMLVMIYEKLPDIPDAARIFKFAPDAIPPQDRNDIVRRLQTFLSEIWTKYPNMLICLEHSIQSKALFEKFPGLNVFDDARISIQGGETWNWAKICGPRPPGP